MNTRQDIHQSRLSGTVLAHQGHDLTLPNGKAHLFQGMDTWESLVHIRHGEQILLFLQNQALEIPFIIARGGKNVKENGVFIVYVIIAPSFANFAE